jgi:hypothetical protein
MALASVSHWRGMPLPDPVFRVLIARLMFVGRPRSIQRPARTGRRTLCSTIGIEPAEVRGSRSVRTCVEARSAPYTFVIVDDYNAVRSLPGGSDRTHRNARWVLTVHARSRKKFDANVRVRSEFPCRHRPVHHPRRQLVLRDTSNGAGLTSDALSDIYDHDPSSLLHGLSHGSDQLSLHSDMIVFVWSFLYILEHIEVSYRLLTSRVLRAAWKPILHNYSGAGRCSCGHEPASEKKLSPVQWHFSLTHLRSSLPFKITFFPGSSQVGGSFILRRCRIPGM